MNRFVIKTILFLFNSCCGGAQSELIKDTSKNNTHFTGNLDQVKETHGFMTERDSNNWKWKFLEETLYIFLSKKKTRIRRTFCLQCPACVPRKT